MWTGGGARMKRTYACTGLKRGSPVSHSPRVDQTHTLRPAGSVQTASVPPRLRRRAALHEDTCWMKCTGPSPLSSRTRIKWSYLGQWLPLIQHLLSLLREINNTFKRMYFPTFEKCRHFQSLFYFEKTWMGFKSRGSTWFPKWLDLAQEPRHWKKTAESLWDGLDVRQLRLALSPSGTG